MREVVLVTGASGHLGRQLISMLREEGWYVRALAHRAAVSGANEVRTASIRDTPAVEDAVTGCSAVIHLAGVTHARRERLYREANVEGTRVVAAAAEHAGANRFVLASSRTATPDAGWYGQSKLAAESVVKGSGLDWTIVRLPELYGASAREGVDDIVQRARSGRRIVVVGSGDDCICPMHVDDAVAALTHALRSAAATRKLYTLAGPCLTVREFADACCAAAGVATRIVHVPRSVVAAAAAAARVLPLPLYPDQPARLHAPKPPASGEAEHELDFRVRDLAEALRELL